MLTKKSNSYTTVNLLRALSCDLQETLIVSTQVHVDALRLHTPVAQCSAIVLQMLRSTSILVFLSFVTIKQVISASMSMHWLAAPAFPSPLRTFNTLISLAICVALREPGNLVIHSSSVHTHRGLTSALSRLVARMSMACYREGRVHRRRQEDTGSGFHFFDPKNPTCTRRGHELRHPSSYEYGLCQRGRFNVAPGQETNLHRTTRPLVRVWLMTIPSIQV
jgi:hypothetical protein